MNTTATFTRLRAQLECASLLLKRHRQWLSSQERYPDLDAWEALWAREKELFELSQQIDAIELIIQIERLHGDMKPLIAGWEKAVDHSDINALNRCLDFYNEYPDEIPKLVDRINAQTRELAETLAEMKSTTLPGIHP